MCTPLIPASERWGQEDFCKSQDSQGYTERTSLKAKNKSEKDVIDSKGLITIHLLDFPDM